MNFLADSNVLIDVLTRSPDWYHWSSACLEEAIYKGDVVLSPVVYSEVSVAYQTSLECNEVLERLQIVWEDIPREAAFLAGKAFSQYRRSGGVKISPLPDFFIGAHALVKHYTLITRDTARYRTYFPALKLIHPPHA